MGIENIVVRSIAMNAGVLERKGVEATFGACIPGELLYTHCKASIGSAFLDHHYLLIRLENLGKGFAVERLERVHGKNGGAFAGRLESIGDRHGPLHDRSIGNNCDIAAGTELAYFAELPSLGKLAGKVRLAGLAKP